MKVIATDMFATFHSDTLIFVCATGKKDVDIDDVTFLNGIFGVSRCYT